VFCSSGSVNCTGIVSRTGMMRSMVALSRPTKLACRPSISGSAMASLIGAICVARKISAAISARLTRSENRIATVLKASQPDLRRCMALYS